jgi:quinol monooxygenase YgiN
MWSSREAHDASLKDKRTMELIAQAMPLIAASPQATELHPHGGKGL